MIRTTKGALPRALDRPASKFEYKAAELALL